MTTDVAEFVQGLWRAQPLIIVLVIAGFLIFCLLVVDTYRHRKSRKQRGCSKRLH